MTQQRGRFITIEGGEGVGKSSNVAAVKGLLQARKIDFIHTREPGGTAVAESIRQLLLQPGDEPLNPVTELLLMFAARSQHLEQLIEPALAAGQWVLCDRFTDATYAYQGAGRNLDWGMISQLENFVQGTLRPDLTIILDLDPAVGLQRARQRGLLDRIELEEQRFFEAVRNCYLKIAEDDPQRCLVIDASHALDQVQRSLLMQLEQWLDKLGSH